MYPENRINDGVLSFNVSALDYKFVTFPSPSYRPFNYFLPAFIVTKKSQLSLSYAPPSEPRIPQFRYRTDPILLGETKNTSMKFIHKACLASIIAVVPFINSLDAQVDSQTDERYSGTTYPIKHVVVIFQENVSFDHYFGTYPKAENLAGEPRFEAKPGTPTVNGLNHTLLTRNQNSLQPQRLDRAHPNTADQDHNYQAEQQAFDHGLMDKFVEFTGTPEKGGPTTVMDYFDGNTVTALWNYAQNFAMNDNSYGTDPGPSTPGALNLISGQTHGATPADLSTAFGPDTVQGTVISDPQPTGDIATTRDNVKMSGRNIGDLLNAKDITWGWFQGGFDHPSATHIGSNGAPKTDYIPHHEPFQYYRQTANPAHLPPKSVALIGKTDQANHQYDITRFWQALDTRNLPAVTFLKAPGYQDGHAGYSDPILEQQFLVETINRLMKSPDWNSLLIVICYDDSDGWYDHAMPPVVNQSQTPYDVFTGSGQSGDNSPLGGYQGRFGYGPRLPFLLISRFAKQNFVDHTITDQSSVLRFIEDNWKLGRIGDSSFDELAGSLVNMLDFRDDHHAHRLFLDPTTGEPTQSCGWQGWD
jgi:phospholipase C